MVGYVADTVGAYATRKSTFRDNIRCFAFCVLIAISNFQYGFDTGILNGFQAMQGFLRVFGVPSPTKPGVFVIETTFQQLITSLLQVGLILSSCVVGPFSVYFGRRVGLFAATIISFVGITIQIVVTVQWPLYIGRLLLGIANGIFVNLTVLYISELAPAHMRGMFVSVFQPFVNVGQFIGAIVSNALKGNLTKHSYQIQLAILYVVPTFLFFAVWFVPESPRWLAVHDRNEDAARSLARIRPRGTTQEDLDNELKDIMESIRLEREIAQTTSWFDIWKGPDLRRTLLCIACATFHAASGINLLVGYSTFFFQIAGSTKPFMNTIIVQCVSVAMAITSLGFARRFGRRTILLIGFTITTICFFAIPIIYTVSPTAKASGRALVALLCIFMGTYGASIGPLSWVTAGEMTSNQLRSHSFGVSMAIGFIFAWLTVFTLPYYINTTGLNLGVKVTWIFAPSNLITLVFIFFFLPETKGRSLEELDELFYHRVPARKFSGYKSQITLSADEVSSSEKASVRMEEKV